MTETERATEKAYAEGLKTRARQVTIELRWTQSQDAQKQALLRGRTATKNIQVELKVGPEVLNLCTMLPDGRAVLDVRGTIDPTTGELVRGCRHSEYVKDDETGLQETVSYGLFAATLPLTATEVVAQFLAKRDEALQSGQRRLDDRVAKYKAEAALKRGPYFRAAAANPTVARAGFDSYVDPKEKP